MKKAVIVALTISFIMTIYTSYIDTEKTERLSFATVEKQFSHPFMIPEDQHLDDPEIIYSLLYDVATDTNVNLFRGTQYYRPDEQVELIKYILLTDETKFYDYIPPIAGKKFAPDEPIDHRLFITSEQTKDVHQIGRIQTFKSLDFTIQLLENAYDHLPVHGRYFVEVKSEKHLEEFLTSLSDHLNAYVSTNNEITNEGFSSSDFQPSEAFSDPMEEIFLIYNTDSAKASKSVVFILTTLLFIYYLFTQSKMIGIYKLHGVSNVYILWKVIWKLITGLVAVFSVTSLIGILSFHLPLSFLGHIMSQLLQAYLILIFLSLLSYLLISRNLISAAIKNKKNTNVIYLLNMIAKVVIASFMLILSLNAIENHRNLRDEEIQFLSQRDQVNEWEKWNDYGVIEAFTGYTTAYNFEELEEDLLRSDRQLTKLYEKLNKQGAIYMDAMEYEQEFLVLNKDYQGIFNATANTNFLDSVPIYDVNGDRITVTEDDHSWIVLVPEQFKHEETEIRNFYEDSRDYFLTEDTGQSLTIIWMKKGQAIFSMNPDVFPEDKNMIMDPVIHIKTEKNNIFAYRGGLTGSGLNNPLKIKLYKSSPELTYGKIEQILKDLQLDGTLKITSFQQNINKKLATIRQEIKYSIYAIIGSFLLFVLLSLQSIIIYFQRNAKHFAVKRLFGIGFFSSYLTVYRRLLFTTLFIILFAITLDQMHVGQYESLIEGYVNQFLCIIVALFSFEAITASIVLWFIEKKYKLKILRQE